MFFNQRSKPLHKTRAEKALRTRLKIEIEDFPTDQFLFVIFLISWVLTGERGTLAVILVWVVAIASTSSLVILGN